MEAGVVHYLDRLGDPFLFLEERIVTVTTAGIHQFTNSLPKILFVIEGTIHHRFDAGRLERLRAGDVLINLRSSRQTYLPVSPTRASYVRVLRLTFPAARENEFARQVLSRLPQKGIALCPLPAWVPEMRSELRSRRWDSRQRIHALARAALIDVTRILEKGSGEGKFPPDRGGRLCETISLHLENHLGSHLTLADIARAVDRSEEHIARVFRQERKRTIFEELQRLRIEKARYLLLCSELNMTAISRECGFSSPAHFSRTFRSHAGMSPSECASQFR
ncbi:MAG: helix-turn-helix domain-containing protein [Terrimicrobiaceae bacterium]